MYSITIIISYKFKILNNKEKPPTTGKLNQWWKQRQLSTCMILNCTSLKKKKKDTNKKIKKISVVTPANAADDRVIVTENQPLCSKGLLTGRLNIA